MEGAEVETYFAALDEALADQPMKKPVRLVVVGGIYMVCFVKNRASTKDVDIVPLDFPDTMNPNQETKAFRAAVNVVAKKYGIKRDWMNDVVASFTPELDPSSVILWHEYPNLQVYVPHAEFILAPQAPRRPRARRGRHPRPQRISRCHYSRTGPGTRRSLRREMVAERV